MGTCFLRAPEGMQPFLSPSIHEKAHGDEAEVWKDDKLPAYTDQYNEKNMDM